MKLLFVSSKNYLLANEVHLLALADFISSIGTICWGMKAIVRAFGLYFWHKNYLLGNEGHLFVLLDFISGIRTSCWEKDFSYFEKLMGKTVLKWV